MYEIEVKQSAYKHGCAYDDIIMQDMSNEEIMELVIEDFRELTPQEIQQDNFRRMFQLLGLIYANQVEIKQLLAEGNHSVSVV